MSLPDLSTFTSNISNFGSPTGANEVVFGNIKRIFCDYDRKEITAPCCSH